MAVVANQAVAFDKSMLTACRFKPANVPIEERTTGGPHLGDVLRPGLILDHARPGNRGQFTPCGLRLVGLITFHDPSAGIGDENAVYRSQCLDLPTIRQSERIHL
jgi:hypothetical protein